ncbi:MAG TPA: radical SAM protein [Bryobacteraceae bacterium]|nr:radical SAM protein [Bryobacteraceae bacterium]
MQVHLINPSDTAFGTAVITPRWLFVLAAATPQEFGDPKIWDETVRQLDPAVIQPGDVVGIGIHTGNALRGYAMGRAASERGAFVVFGGIHPSLYPDEPFEYGAANCVVRGDGDIAWGQVLTDYARGSVQRVYDGGRVEGDRFKAARWDLLNRADYMWASVQTVRGCAKHCSFCSVWRTDGQRPRQRTTDAVVEELVQLRRIGFRFIALADDNFYPVSLTDIRLAERQNNQGLVSRLQAMRAERFELMERLAELPSDMVFFTQITMEAAEDPEFLIAMKKARIKGALVGVEAVTKEGLKAVFKDFNLAGEGLVERLRLFEEHGVHVLGSFIFGLPTDRADTFAATEELARRSRLTFAQFVMLTPFCGTVDFERWEKSLGDTPPTVAGVPITRYWLIPPDQRPKMFMPHPTMSSEELRARTQGVWDNFYSLPQIWKRSRCATNIKARLAFVFVSKLYRQMYASTGIATDSARRERATAWARRIAKVTHRLFLADPRPDLQVPSSAKPERAAGPLQVLQ